VTVAFSGLLSGALESAFTESATDVWAAEGLTVSAGAGMYDHLYLHPFPAALDPASLDPGALDPSGLDRRNVRRMRPLNFDGGNGGELPAWVAAFGAERPGVYVTFGTEIAALAPWPAIVEAIGALDVDAVLTLGPHLDPDGLPPVPPNIRVERYVPQACLLDRARLVVSHAGAGTLLAAATRGLPQLCIPIAADQWDNADAITLAEAALTLEPPQRDAATIHSVLETLLADARIGAASVRLADDFAALPHPDNYVDTITNLVTGN
jgi:UDP:flavonoid glycosyltransferase YjiC (YdhE family)